MNSAGEKLLDALRWRYAVKKFDPSRQISSEDWSTIEEALVLTASSYGLQPWKFIVVTSPEMKEKLKPASWNQSQVTDSSHFVIFLTKTTMTADDVERHAKNMAAVRGIDYEKTKGYRDSVIKEAEKRTSWAPEWNARQAYLALGNLLTTAAVLGIDACPMEGLEPDEYDKILGITGTGYQTIVACALGYRHPDDQFGKMKKVRFDRDELVRKI